MKKEILVALAGNPNVGKSTLFNMLTGETAHVANWPGVTVAVKEGNLIHHGKNIRVVDLPGTYSLSAEAEEEAEAIARDFIVRHNPDVVVVVVDATALERTMYLLTMVLELTPRVVVAVNMMDAADRRGIHIDLDGLSKTFKIPFVGTIAVKGKGLGVLLDRILDMVEGLNYRKEPLKIDYDGLEPYIKRMTVVLKGCKLSMEYPLRWLAVRILERDPSLINRLEKEVKPKALEVLSKAERDLSANPQIISIESRYRFLDATLKGKIITTKIITSTFGDKLDEIFLNSRFGGLLSITLLFLSFLVVFSINMGFPLNLIFSDLGFERAAEFIENYSLSGIVSRLVDIIAEYMNKLILEATNSAWISGLIVDGAIRGVGAVISFLPLILTTYIMLGALQDSGVMSRVAVSLDKLFRRFGLSGKAVFPAVIGMGCSVPAVLSTRVMDDDRERMVTAMSSPLIPCQARLVVMLAFSKVISNNLLIQTSTIIGFYLMSIILYLAISLILNKVVFKVKTPPEIMLEIPPYHKPSPRVIWWYSKTNTLKFLYKAGSIIFGLNIVVWLTMHFGPGGAINPLELNENPMLIEKSIAYMLGKALAPIGYIIGLPDWRIMFGFATGVVAKESLLSTFVTLTGAKNVEEAISLLNITPLKSLALITATITYLPCVATLSVLFRELKMLKYVLIVLIYELLIAIILSAAIYWLGTLIAIILI